MIITDIPFQYFTATKKIKSKKNKEKCLNYDFDRASVSSKLLFRLCTAYKMLSVNLNCKKHGWWASEAKFCYSLLHTLYLWLCSIDMISPKSYLVDWIYSISCHDILFHFQRFHRHIFYSHYFLSKFSDFHSNFPGFIISFLSFKVRCATIII